MTTAKPELWGIDLGGTKAEGVILGPGGTQDVRFRDRVPTGADQGYEHVLSRLTELVAMMERSAGYRPKNLGIGTPGTLVYTRRLPMWSCQWTQQFSLTRNRWLRFSTYEKPSAAK